MPLTDFIQSYQQSGISFPIPVLSHDQALDYRKQLENFETARGASISGRQNKKIHLLYPWANELIRQPKILDAVEKIIGPNILCWGSEVFCKEAHSSNFVSWHQDATYWGIGTDQILTAWVALSDSSTASGCMRVVPESHNTQVDHEDSSSEGNLLSRGQEIAVEVDESKAVDVQLKPGEMSMHHVLIFHGSKPNTSNDKRMGFVIRFLPPHLKPTSGIDSATLVRGKDEYGHFELEPSPSATNEPEMVAYHRNVCDKLEARLMNVNG
jgi:non-haem Fe2+, alpha-ketoglutarate-dependent halogenase